MTPKDTPSQDEGVVSEGRLLQLLGKPQQKWENIDLAGSLAKPGLKDLFAVEEWPAVNAVRELATRIKKAAEGIAPCSDATAKPFVFSGLKQYVLHAGSTCRKALMCAAGFSHLASQTTTMWSSARKHS